MAQIRTLAELGLTAQGGRQARVTALATDSRAVEDGALFAALPGTHTHGARFIATALDRGAGAILTGAAGAVNTVQSAAGQ